jgi:hypothetical protein
VGGVSERGASAPKVRLFVDFLIGRLRGLS